MNNHSLSTFASPVLSLAKWLRHSSWVGYAMALVTFALALAARFKLEGMLATGFPFLTFFPAIVLTAFFGGRGPGALCAVLSVIAAWFWFVTPDNPFSLDFQTVLVVIFFAAIAAVDVIVIDLMTRALERLEAVQRETDALVEQRTTLFHELQHRVANNHMMVALVLAVQEKRLAHNPEAVEALQMARRKFVLLSRIHRRLYDPANANMPFRPYFRGLCDEYLSASDATNIVCHVDSVEVSFDSDRTITLSLLILEILANSIKHAFDVDQAGIVQIRLEETGPSQYLLTVQDNGRGTPPGFDVENSERLGMSILQGFARSMQGQLSVSTPEGGAGTIVRMSFPFTSVPGRRSVADNQQAIYTTASEKFLQPE